MKNVAIAVNTQKASVSQIVFRGALGFREGLNECAREYCLVARAL